MSESGAGDAGSDDDNVGVGVSGSTFSFSGGDAVHGLASRVWRISTVIVVLLLGHKSINRHERENRGQDPSQRVLIHHFHQCVRHRAQESPSLWLSLSLSLALPSLSLFVYPRWPWLASSFVNKSELNSLFTKSMSFLYIYI